MVEIAAEPHGLPLARAAAAAALLALGLAVSMGPALPPAAGERTSAPDLELYRGIVGRLRAGEGYYAAAGAELRQPRTAEGLSFPAASVLNWRLPSLAWLLALLPEGPAASGLFLGLATLGAAAAFSLVSAEANAAVAAGVAALLFSGFLWALPSFVPEALFVHEAWAGLLLALALVARAKGWTLAALAAGLTALFIRELALPGALLLAAFAGHERRWRELAAWFAGIALFFAAWLWHAHIVGGLILPTDRAHPEGWLQFGGWPFVLKTAHLHPLLIGLLPTAPWVVAALLPIALLGLCRWRGRLGPSVALAVLGYCAAYCCVGQPFNYFWGLMWAPLWPLGLVFAWPAVRETIRSLRRPPRA